MNSLDAILDAHKTARDAMKVVRRCASVEGIDEDRPFRNTRFHGIAETMNFKKLLSTAENELDDLTVLSLYATFEKLIREHLSAQSLLLHAATSPDDDFGASLARIYVDWTSDSLRLDRAVGLFESAVGQELISQVGQIRTYRHWVAHGKRMEATPPSTDPQWTYDILTQFLTLAGLVT